MKDIKKNKKLKKKNETKKNNNDVILKNQSVRNINFNKIEKNNDSYLVNYYSNNQNKIAPNHSLAYFSTASTTKNFPNNNTNLYTNNNTSSNYINTEKFSNCYSTRDIIKKNNNMNSVNKIIKEKKTNKYG